MRSWMILVVAAALSGCADAPPEPDPSGQEPEPAAPPEPGPAPPDPQPAANETEENLIPIVTLTPDATNGSAPLRVNFTLHITDDSDAIQWQLFVDGNATRNGSSVLASFNHTFGAGNWSVQVLVTDGVHNVSATSHIAVVEPGPHLTISGTTTAAGSPLSSGIVSGAAPGLGAKACTGFLQGENEADCVFGSLPAALAGHAYRFAGEGSNPDHEFLESCHPTAEVVQGYAETGVEGEVPASAGCVVMWFFSSATGPLQLDVY